VHRFRGLPVAERSVSFLWFPSTFVYIKQNLWELQKTPKRLRNADIISYSVEAARKIYTVCSGSNMPRQQRDARLRTNIPPILGTPTHNKFTLLQQNHTIIMKIEHGRLKYRRQFEGQLKKSLIVYQTLPRKWGAHTPTLSVRQPT
jgi:hypothetical protein